MEKSKKLKKSKDWVNIMCYSVLIMIVVVMFVIKNSL